MRKPPAFNFYAQDFLQGVTFLTNEETGIYIKILAKQWTDGEIRKKRLGFLVGIEWESFSIELKEKFVDNGEAIYNKRLEIERDKKNAFIQKQALNGSKGGRPKKNKNPEVNPNDNPKETQAFSESKPKQKPLEIEIENRNTNTLSTSINNNLKENFEAEMFETLSTRRNFEVIAMGIGKDLNLTEAKYNQAIRDFIFEQQLKLKKGVLPISFFTKWFESRKEAYRVKKIRTNAEIIASLQK